MYVNGWAQFCNLDFLFWIQSLINDCFVSTLIKKMFEDFQLLVSLGSRDRKTKNFEGQMDLRRRLAVEIDDQNGRKLLY